jgi:hypothetical protein
MYYIYTLLQTAIAEYQKVNLCQTTLGTGNLFKRNFSSGGTSFSSFLLPVFFSSFSGKAQIRRFKALRGRVGILYHFRGDRLNSTDSYYKQGVNNRVLLGS